MTKILLVVCITLAIYQDDCLGKMFDENQDVVSDTEYPDSETLTKRNSYQVTRNADRNTVAWPERPSNCFFVHEAEMKSQISCRLRFARSKFNFNPFGLRFGKRGSISADSKPDPKGVIRKFLGYLLNRTERHVFPCRDKSVGIC
uniref:Kisspeptin 2 n=1 Tax=Leptobrachium leishanense TaxID=445787 RepID=A0A8C5MWI4_9ANUR